MAERFPSGPSTRPGTPFFLGGRYRPPRFLPFGTGKADYQEINSNRNERDSVESGNAASIGRTVPYPLLVPAAKNMRSFAA